MTRLLGALALILFYAAVLALALLPIRPQVASGFRQRPAVACAEAPWEVRDWWICV